MPLMKITELGRRNMYLTRSMWADDQHAYIESECVEPAKQLGYAVDPEPSEPEPAPRRRGRPPASAAELEATKELEAIAAPPSRSAGQQDRPPLHELTVPELHEIAHELGIDLGSEYVKKDDLIDLIKKAQKDA